MQVEELFIELKARVAKGLNFGIEAVEEVLEPSSALYNDFILLKSKYNDLMYISSQNTMSYEQIELGLDRLRSGLLGLINKMDKESLKKEEVQSDLNVQALPTRRTNFFKLLDIHFLNLDAVAYTELFGSEERNYFGREGMFQLYQSCRRQNRNAPEANEVRAFFRDYFSNDSGMLEVYFKNVKHMLAYALSSEIEQPFFLNTLRSLFSRFELAFIFYYCFSDMDPDFSQAVRSGKLLDSSIRDILISPDHWESGSD
jgi:hypothetical protein